MLAFPLLDPRRRELIVRVLRGFRAYLEHNGWAEQLFRRNLIDSRFPRRKMNRRIEVRAVVFQHPEAARKVAVLLDGGIDLRFKVALVARPGHQLVINRVAEIEHASLSRWDVGQHIISTHALRKEREESGEAGGKNIRPVEHTHAVTSATSIDS